jgi:NADPH-dependent curcumin reductase CurA
MRYAARMTQTNRVFLLRERPNPEITDRTLELVERPMPEPGEGEVLVRNLWLSLDPTNRGWMNAQATYLPPIPVGEPMRGIAVGRVVRSNDASVPQGALVTGMLGFGDYAVRPAAQCTVLPPGVDPKLALGALGHIGLTAWFGLTEVGKVQPSDTVLVSAAAGATGSLVAQIAKLKGCRVVGTAGSDDKCAWLTGELGLDGAINYRSCRTTGDLTRAVAERCPKGVDVFFDNVGGDVLDAALANLAMRGRVVVCGAISQYNRAQPQGPKNYLNLIVKRGRMEGFVVLDYLARAPEALAALMPWLAQGKLQQRFHVIEGLENAVAGLKLLFSGGNTGKLLVHIADE